MIGDLHQVRNGWAVEPPRHCANGHRLGPYQVTLCHEPCSCTGGHHSWSCHTCGDVTYWPPVGPACTVLNGPAKVRTV